MPRGIPNNREVQSADFYQDESEGGLDWNMLRTGQSSIEAVSEREFKETADMEAFMNEPLVIVVHKSSDRNAPPRVPVGLNGEKVWLPCDTRIRNIPRRLVGVLAQSQIATYTTDDNPNPNADEGKIIHRRNSQCYPFAVIHDPNPKGAAWLRRVMREA